MDSLSPAVTKFLLHRATRKLQPGLIKEGAELIQPRHPDHDWSCVSYSSKPLLAFAQRSFGMLSCGQVLHCPNNTPGIARIVARNVGAVVDMGPLAIGSPKTVLARPTGFVA